MALVKTYQPTGVLKPVDENIWIVDGPVEHMQQFGFTVPFPTRMTVIRLKDQSLFIHSPVKPGRKLFAAIDALGPVAHLISPNKLHYAAIYPWSKQYPDALCWASPGVRERAQKHHIRVHFDHDLRPQPAPAWSDEIDQIIFEGSRFMDEVVFFHKSSRTVILADLIENFEPEKLNTVMRWLVRLAGNLDPDGKLPIDLRMTFLGRHKQACNSLGCLLDWQPQRIILSHGRWYDRNGVEELKRAFRWLSC